MRKRAVRSSRCLVQHPRLQIDQTQVSKRPVHNDRRSTLGVVNQIKQRIYQTSHQSVPTLVKYNCSQAQSRAKGANALTVKRSLTSPPCRDPRH